MSWASLTWTWSWGQEHWAFGQEGVNVDLVGIELINCPVLSVFIVTDREGDGRWQCDKVDALTLCRGPGIEYVFMKLFKGFWGLLHLGLGVFMLESENPTDLFTMNIRHIKVSEIQRTVRIRVLLILLIWGYITLKLKGSFSKVI